MSDRDSEGLLLLAMVLGPGLQVDLVMEMKFEKAMVYWRVFRKSRFSFCVFFGMRLVMVVDLEGGVDFGNALVR
jgi:hypothetical protein